jgi:hypothetical protein
MKVASAAPLKSRAALEEESPMRETTFESTLESTLVGPTFVESTFVGPTFKFAFVESSFGSIGVFAAVSPAFLVAKDLLPLDLMLSPALVAEN